MNSVAKKDSEGIIIQQNALDVAQMVKNGTQDHMAKKGHLFTHEEAKRLSQNHKLLKVGASSVIEDMRKEFFLLRYHINVIERKYLHQKFNRATWRKVLTLDQIERRGFYLTNRCFLCLSEVETVDHILLHCAKLWVLWDLLFSLIGVSWVPSCLVKESLLG